MIDKDISSYMEQFKVDRATAIKEIAEELDCYYKKQEKELEEVQRDIIRSSY